jgi:hypothetical protein
MNSKSVISSAAIALCLLVGSSAFAQGNDGRNDRGRNDQAQRRGQGEDRGHGYQPGHRDNQARQDGDIRSVVQARTMTSAKAGAFLTNIAAANTWLMIGAATA